MPRILVCGAINWDTTLFVENLPKPGEEVKVGKVISVPGGKGGNTAVAAARILGKNQVGIIGMLGSDRIADVQQSIFEEEGVDVSCLSRHNEMKSGEAYVIVDNAGENIVLTHRAANNGLAQQMISTQIASAISNSKTLIIIDPPLDIAAELASPVRNRDRTVILSPATLVYQGFAALKSLLLAADYIILNQHEACALADEHDAPSACGKLSEILDGKRIITTLGARGSIICHEGMNEIVPTMDPTLFGFKVVSTVGAGDTFVGAFASFKIEGRSDLEAIFLANIAAALKITAEQTRGSPHYGEILKYAESDIMRPTYDRVRIS